MEFHFLIELIVLFEYLIIFLIDLIKILLTPMLVKYDFDCLKSQKDAFTWGGFTCVEDAATGVANTEINCKMIGRDTRIYIIYLIIIAFIWYFLFKIFF